MVSENEFDRVRNVVLLLLPHLSKGLGLGKRVHGLETQDNTWDLHATNPSSLEDNKSGVYPCIPIYQYSLSWRLSS